VAATRARARLTLLSPADAAQRSSFIAQLRLPKSSAAAEAAWSATSARGRHAGRPPLPDAGFNDKDQVKALGAKFDIARRAWYVESDTDLKPFAPWLKK
jgi:DNA helicase-2/ATP-dependent DNA helicase PcrA